MLVSQVAVSCCGRLPLWFCCVVNTLLITGLEFVTGCVVNLGFGWNVWNYTNQPLNLMGTGLYRLHRAVVFAERSGNRACLPGAPPPAGEKGDRIGALLSGVALGVAAAAGRGPRWGGGRKSPHTAPWPAGEERISVSGWVVDVAQRDIAVRVEAAGHHCPVGQHAELVAQAVAEHLVGKVGPARCPARQIFRLSRDISGQRASRWRAVPAPLQGQRAVQKTAVPAGRYRRCVGWRL